MKPLKPPDFMDPSMIPGFMQLQMQYMQQMQDYMAQCHQYAQQAAACAGWTTSEQPPPSFGPTPPVAAPQPPAAAAAPLPSSIPMPATAAPTPAAVKNEGSVLSYIQQQHEQLVAEHVPAPDDEELVEYDPPVDVAALNQKIIDLDDELFYQLEASRWCPELAVFKWKEPRPQKKSVIVID